MDNTKFIEIANSFELDSKAIKLKPLGEGFINDTFIVETELEIRYILQKKNSNIFKDIPGMMSNIVNICDYLKDVVEECDGDSIRETMTPIINKNGEYFLLIDGEFWTMTLFIEDTITYSVADTLSLCKAGGAGLGKFQSQLADFKGELVDTLPGFHNMRFRFQQWDASLKTDSPRIKEVAQEISWIEARRGEMLDFYSLIESGEIPLRVTHNDTKISNFLFDAESSSTEEPKVLCVIDLDTVLRAPCLYDFGDAIRSYANTGAEDDPCLENVSLSMERYQAYYDGYTSEANFLTDIEKKYLPFSARYICFEQVLRFLMDYIDGDTYYRIKYPEHNLVRARAQYKLLQSMEESL